MSKQPAVNDCQYIIDTPLAISCALEDARPRHFHSALESGKRVCAKNESESIAVHFERHFALNRICHSLPHHVVPTVIEPVTFSVTVAVIASSNGTSGS